MAVMDQDMIDDLRGHEFLPDALRTRIPDLYSTDGQPFKEKTIYVRYFCGAATWLIAELGTGEDADLAFGHCDLGLGFPEWGNVSLRELREMIVRVRGLGLGLVVERDLHFQPTLFAAIDR